MKTVLWETTLRGGGMRSFLLKRNREVRFTANDHHANLALLCYHADRPYERYNMADTLKGQHTAFLTKGNCLYSDMGRVLLSITEDEVGWHDTISGVDTAEEMVEKWGAFEYQEQRNNFHRNGRDNFLIELGKWNLGKKDLVSNVNLFSKVWIEEATGKMNYSGFEKTEGKDSVTLRAELDTIVVLTATHHPLYDGEYNPSSIQIEILEENPASPEDFCRNHCEQNGRAFENTENYVQFGV